MKLAHSQEPLEAWWYIRSCATMLALTGAVKLYSVLHPSLAMAQSDPVLGIRYSLLMSAVGFFEIAAAVALFWSSGNRRALDFLMWLGCVFILYHLAWWFTGARGLCPCMGNLFKMSVWMQYHQNVLVWAIIFYLVFGSLALRYDFHQTLKRLLPSALPWFFKEAS